MKEEAKEGDKGGHEEKKKKVVKEKRRISKDSLFGDEDGSVSDARDEEGWRKRV